MGAQFCKEDDEVLIGETTKTNATNQQYHWGYEPHNGPETWCLHYDAANGKEQSPIDIDTSIVETSNEVEELENTKIELYYSQCQATCVNNGHAIQWNVNSTSDGCYALRDGKQYNLVQFHYHIPSEHTINSVLTAIEIHFVHQEPESKELLVIGHCYDPGMTNTFLAPIINFRPLMVKGDSTEVENIDLSFLESDGEYVHYKGSLTTPPCSEGVQWYVNKRIGEISHAQLSWFKTCVPFETNRPVMPLNGRSCICTTVSTSKSSVCVPAE